MKKLSTDPYKGVRDFYPEDMRIQNWIFERMRMAVESYGYTEYSASLLEPSDLYRAKSGEEIVSEQTYTFTDRGDREVTLRPEMTPTVARMVAGKKRELPFPLRWYSIPNLFRYENPQKGRLREHYQLNVDLFGLNGIEADAEIIAVASNVMSVFGATTQDFSVLINSRNILTDIYNTLEIPEDKRYTLAKIIDKKEKISPELYTSSLRELIGDSADTLVELLNTNKKLIEFIGEDNASVKNLISLIEMLESRGITNVVFTPTLMRGFDYYTDMVFEIIDTNRENKRSLFGGGRFDSLTALFNDETVPAVGFGMGDVTIRDFLETHKLLPQLMSTTDVVIGAENEDALLNATLIAKHLRTLGVRVVEYGIVQNNGKLYAFAEKSNVRFVMNITKVHLETHMYILKFTYTDQGGEKEFSNTINEGAEHIAEYIKNARQQ